MSEALLSSLRRKRGIVQGAITSFVKILDGWQQNEERDKDYLQAALETLQRAFLKFDDIQEQLEELDKEESAKRETIQTSHDKAIARARKFLRGDELCNESSTTRSSTPVSNPIPVTLPTITLPTFDGSVENWTSFFDIFSALIDKNTELSPVRKLQYLRLSLKGKAAHVIESLETTEKNYEVAINLLKKKYECTRRTLRRHWAILREYPRLQKDSPAGLSHLVDTFQQHIRALETHQAPVEQWDIPLIDLILTKISSSTVWNWELTLTGNDMPSYKGLLSFLEKRANCIEFSTAASIEHSNAVKNNTQKLDATRARKPGLPAAQSYLTSTINAPDPTASTSKACPFCSGSHSSYRCQVFQAMSVDERQKAVSSALLCFNCLGRGHGIQECSSTLTCRKCKKRHHTFLHRTASANKTPIESVRNSTSSRNAEEEERA